MTITSHVVRLQKMRQSEAVDLLNAITDCGFRPQTDEFSLFKSTTAKIE
jgi:hypothetical protein